MSEDLKERLRQPVKAQDLMDPKTGRPMDNADAANALDARDAEIARLRAALERRDSLLVRARIEVRIQSIELQAPPEDEELLTDIEAEWRDHPCDGGTND